LTHVFQPPWSHNGTNSFQPPDNRRPTRSMPANLNRELGGRPPHLLSLPVPERSAINSKIVLGCRSGNHGAAAMSAGVAIRSDPPPSGLKPRGTCLEARASHPRTSLRSSRSPFPGKSVFRVQRQNGHNVHRGRGRETRDQVERAGRRQYVGIWGRSGKSPPCVD
jgi:hypothetical protein